MKPEDLIVTARHLAMRGGGRKPRQADLRRAQSTACYACFHALCRLCADMMIGTTGAERSGEAWRQAYRAVDHGFVKKLFSGEQKPKILGQFPAELQDFANAFVALQKKRHDADYDPDARFKRSEVLSDIDAADFVIKRIGAVSLRDRRAFAAWVVFKSR